MFSTFLKHTLKSKKKEVQILVLQRIKHFFNSYDHANTFKSTNSLLQVVSEKTNIKILIEVFFLISRISQGRIF